MTPVCPLAYRICDIYGWRPNVAGKPIHRPFRVARPIQSYEENALAKQRHSARLRTENERKAVARAVSVLVERQMEAQRRREEALALSLVDEQGGPITVRTALRFASEILDMDPAAILSRSRTKHLNHARRALVIVGRDFFHMSYPQIGRALNRDHTSVINADKKARDMLQSDKAFVATIAEITRRLKAEIREAA